MGRCSHAQHMHAFLQSERLQAAQRPESRAHRQAPQAQRSLQAVLQHRTIHWTGVDAHRMGWRRVSLEDIRVYYLLRYLQARIFRQVTKHWPQRRVTSPSQHVFFLGSCKHQEHPNGYQASCQLGRTAEPNIHRKRRTRNLQ